MYSFIIVQFPFGYLRSSPEDSKSTPPTTTILLSWL